jgi:light-regulated signal transduction histidine kinase (bacteriophytochrome)
MSPKKEVLFNNQVALDMLGLSIDELYQKTSVNPDWSIVYEDGSSFPCDVLPVPIAIHSKKPVTNVIVGVNRPLTKDKVWLLVNAEPLLNDKGEIREVVCSFSDITKQKAVEEKLTWLYQSLEVRALELATSNNELERFAYIATHDLQEPLRLVSSFTELLKKKYASQLDEQAVEYINYAVEGASRMKNLILDLQEFTKFSSNKEEFTKSNLNKLLEKVTNTLAEKIKCSETVLIIPDLPVINAKATLISQLFENLIGNAIKYRSSKKPLVIIDCKEEPDYYEFSVSDNGIGIDEDYWDKIFVLFKRLHRNNEIFEGTGVGLAVCKKIVELHHGNICVRSEKGKGSTFYFTISKKVNNSHEEL